MNSGQQYRRTRVRRSKKLGSSWTARSRRLKTISGRVSVHAEIQSVEELLDDSHTRFITPNHADNKAAPYDEHDDQHDQEDDGCVGASHIQETRNEAMELILNDCNNVHGAIRKSFKHLTCEVLVAILTLYGKCYFNTKQYEHLCEVLQIFECQKSLPSLSSIRKVKWPFFYSALFPKSITVKFASKTRHTTPYTINSLTSTCNDHGSNEDNDDEENQQKHEHDQTKKLVVVPISEWARYDISNVVVQRAITQPKLAAVHDGVGVTKERIIEQAPILCRSSEVCSEPDSLFLQTDEYVTQAVRGDKISVTCITNDTYNKPCGFNCCTTDDQTVVVSGFVSFTFCPGANGQSLPHNQSFMAHYISAHYSELSKHEANIFTYLKLSIQGHSSAQRSKLKSSEFHVLPADVCTVLLPGPVTTDNTRSISTFSVLVNRFWRTQGSGNSQIMFSFKCDLHDPSQASIDLVFRADVKDAPRLYTTNSRNRRHSIPQTHGKLEDGRTFYVYRVLLYCDDFLPRSGLFPKGSVGGFYMIPLSMGLRRRRGLGAIRTISLTPSGVSTNLVFDYLIDDILKATVQGIPAIDANGNLVYIFIEVVGFVGDYPESSKVIDVLSHSAGAPCTMCSFRYRHLTNAAKYAYAITIHSFNSAFTRGMRRTLSLRSRITHNDDLKFLGMKEGTTQDMNDAGRWPLVKMACELDKCRGKIPKTSDGHTVVSEHFDAYSRNAIAPDHLLAGLGKYLLETIFLLLPSDIDRIKLDIILCQALRSIGMGSHACLFNNKTKTSNSLSMSTVYSVITVLPSILRVLNHHHSLPVFNLVDIFNQLVSLTFWWPLPSTDGISSFLYIHGDQKVYFNDMLRLATKFVEMIDQLSSTSSIVLSMLDRPNTHRMIELYASTIPHFSHALFCVDMGFEANHQPLKSSLSRNSNMDSNISAVYHNLGRDWFARVTELMAMRLNHSDQAKSINRGLRRLFFGANSDGLDETKKEDLSLMNDMDERINCLLTPRLIERLNSWYSSSLTDWSDGEWVGLTQSPVGNAFISEQTASMVATTYSSWFAENSQNEDNVSFFSNATFIQKIGTAVRRRYKHHSLTPGDIFGCFLLEEPSFNSYVTPSNTGEGFYVVFFLLALLGFKRENLCVLATVGVKVGEDGHSNLFKFNINTHKALVQLTPEVRKAFAIHACDIDEGCKIDERRKEIAHCINPTSTLYFRVISRQNGYPPRRA